MNRFHFKGFEPEESLKLKANHCLNRMLDLAPYGSTALALLERDGDIYRCTFDLYSLNGPFMASALYASPEEALVLTEKKLAAQIQIWRTRRFGEGSVPLTGRDSPDRGLGLPFKTFGIGKERSQ